MHLSSLLALAASVAAASAQTYQGFNYGSTFSDGRAITEPEYEAQFNAAKNLVGTSGFTSARIYTLIQAGTPNTPIDAIQAAINTKTSLLLGVWASAGQTNIDNELAAFRAAVAAHGSEFTDLIVGISVGSEDLYRISTIGIENESGVGAGPDVVADYINQVKDAIADTPAAGTPVGHVDTWTAWVNGSNSAVVTASDFIGMDAYPYFQNTMTNDIGSGYSLFFSAYDQTVAAAAGKPVWVTETGWPVSGPTENLAVPNTDDAKIYWDQVGCGRLFGQVNTWWYTLQDAFPNTPSPSFGVVGAGLSGTDVPTTPLYDLSCSDKSSNSVSSSSVIPSSANAAASAQAAGNNGAQRQNKVEQSGPNASASGTPSETSAPSSPQSSPSNTGGASAPSNAGATSPAAGAASSKASPTTLITKTTALPSASAGPSGCPASLSGNFEFPHLIVPISKNTPDVAQGTSFNGTISPSTSSIFNFDIPAADSGKICSLIFLFPTQANLKTSAYSIKGTGGFNVQRLESPATEQTTYNSVSKVDREFGGPADVVPGNEYVIASGPCNADDRKGYKVSATGSLDLNYFQDLNPSPIGFYVTVC